MSALRTSALALLASLGVAGPSLAQVADRQPSAKPRTQVLEIRLTKFVSDGYYANGMMLIKSLTGEPVPIFVDYYKSGWSGFTSSGKVCQSSGFATHGIPAVRLDVNSLRGHDPQSFAAGVGRAAVVPLKLNCGGLKPGEEVTFSATIHTLVGNRWTPQQFSWEQTPIE